MLIIVVLKKNYSTTATTTITTETITKIDRLVNENENQSLTFLIKLF